MKKFILALAVVLGVYSLSFAHPPQDIKISYDAKTKLVTAVIYHNVSNPENHYIKTVDVGLNGKEIISQTISRQDNNQTQTVIFFIPEVKPSDKVSVEGYCSISGSLVKEIIIQ